MARKNRSTRFFLLFFFVVFFLPQPCPPSPPPKKNYYMKVVWEDDVRAMMKKRKWIRKGWNKAKAHQVWHLWQTNVTDAVRAEYLQLALQKRQELDEKALAAVPAPTTPIPTPACLETSESAEKVSRRPSFYAAIGKAVVGDAAKILVIYNVRSAPPNFFPLPHRSYSPTEKMLSLGY